MAGDGNGATAAAGRLGNGVCDAGEVCLWEDSNFKGCFVDLYPGIERTYTDGSPRWNYTPRGKNCNHTVNDKVSSYWNRSSGYMKFRNNSYGSAEVNFFCAKQGASSGNLKNFKDGWSRYTFGWNPNDSFSAHAPGEANFDFGGCMATGRYCGCYYGDSD